jgi:hypothetical protein
MCLHEPIDDNVPVPEDSYENSGQSGSHLLMPEYSAMESDLRVFIKRNSADAYDSMCAVIGGIDIETYRKIIYEPSREYEAFADIVIDFDNLFTEDAVKYVWNTISDRPFQRDKVLHMMNMNVQRESLDYSFGDKYIKKCVDEFKRNFE